MELEMLNAVIAKEVVEGYRLSPQQKRLWTLHLSEHDTTFCAQCIVQIDGQLDPRVLKEALQSVVDGHEILRTSFYRQPGVRTPIQVIAHRGAFSWHELNLADRDLPEQMERIEELYRGDRERGFNFEVDSLLRVSLVALSANRHILLLSLPALCADACAIENLVSEISLSYATVGEDRKSCAEVAQYLPFSEWQNELLEDDEAAEGKEYWNRQDLFPAPAVVLPSERRVENVGFKPEVFATNIDPSLMANLRASAQRCETPINLFLLATWQTLLWRLTRETAITVGNMCNLRNYEGMDKAIGLFAKWLPERGQFHESYQFIEILRAVYKHTVEAEEWQEYFIWEPPGIANDRSGFPSVGFEYAEQKREKSAAGVSFVISEQYVCHDRFKVKLSCVERNASLIADFHYDSLSFHPEDIKRLAAEFHCLLASAVKNPEMAIGEFELVSDSEREQVLVEFNQTEVEYPKGKYLVKLFEEQAERRPEAVAIVYEDETVTYGELNSRANQVARHLQGLGVRPEVVVGLCVERSAEMVVGLLGILKAGGAYLPLDPGYPQARLRFMMADSQTKVLLTQEKLVQGLPLDQTQVAHVVCLDADWEEITGHREENPEVEVHGDNLAYVIYTSGSSGQPKGVMVSQQAISNHMMWMQATFEFGESDAVLQKTPFSFDASVWEFYAPLFAGGRLVMARPGGHQDSDYLVKAIAEAGVTILQLVPTLLQMLVKERGLEECGSLKRVFCGGEALTRSLADSFHERLGGVELYNLYGPTEAAIDATWWKCGAGSEGSGVPIGRPIANLNIFILDGEMKPVPVGVKGELYIGGEGLARGYQGRADLTAERFVPHPYSASDGARLYRTGDVGRYLSQGEIEYVGRVDNQVKVRGYRIELAEVEAALLSREQVSEAVVVVCGEGEAERRLVAFLVCDDGAALTSVELRDHLMGQLPDYMVPGQFVMLERMPLTPSGKIDRRALPALDAGHSALADSYVAPRTPTEEILAGIWTQLLPVEQVGIHDDFFALGGHSLLATQLVSRVRNIFQVEVALRQLFEVPTIAGLVTEIERLKMVGEDLQSPPIAPVPREETTLLSYAQQRLWFLDQLEPNSSFYNIPAAVRLQGRLDITALEHGFREVVRRHESLRTRFGVVDGVPVQLIDEAPAFTLTVLDLSTIDESERETEARRVASDESRSPFDLSVGPLLRATVLRLSEQEHVLLCTMHHIISDGWSMGVLIRELTTLYKAYATGQQSPLPELEIQYPDFAHWQREWLQGEVLERQLTYWREQLAGAPPLLELPADYPRPAVQSFRGAHQVLTLSESLSTAVKTLTQRSGVTLFMTLLAAFQSLLSRYSGQEEIVVGTPIAGRNRTETENLIGFFINTLVLRTNLSGDPSFAELLRRVREVALGAYAHQEVPFEKLVEELQPERDMSRTPLFQVMMVLQNAPMAETAQIEGLQVSGMGGESGSAKFDLTLSVSETGDGRLQTLWEYNTDLFGSETIARMMSHFEVLLDGVVDNPDQQISELTVLGDAEQEQILVDWNSTAVEYPRSKCIHQLFEEQVARTPGAVALVYEQEKVTYSELNEKADRLAHYLQSLGVGPESLVGLCVERSVEMMVGVLGILKAGGAYVPIDPAYPAQRLSFMLADAQVSVLLTQEHLVESLPEHGAMVVCLDGARKHEWEAETSTYPSGKVECEATADNLAYMIYTSGSTGQPKGAMTTHEAICNRLQWMQEAYQLDATDSVLQKTPISFDVSVWELFWPLMTGARMVLARPGGHKENGYLVKLMAEEEVTTVHFVPSMLQAFVEEDGLEGCERIRRVICSGEALGKGLQDRFMERLGWAELYNLYGPTEAAVDVTWWRCRPESGRRAVPIGRPIANLSIYILDHAMKPVPVGVSGELYIGGVGLARGYRGRAELTAERFVPHPHSAEPGGRLYRTGDVARYREDGEIEYVGRMDNQVKLRGYRIELGEIEAALATHVNVEEAAVLARQDESGDKRLVAYVVNRENAAVTSGELRDHLAGQLPDYMVPSRFVMLARMPLTPSGKLDRRALPAPDQSRPEMEGQFVGPCSPVEEVLTGIWSGVLRIEQIGVNDNFFELGGHSLLATQVISRVRESFGVKLGLRVLFEHPTVRGMAAAIGETQRADRGMEEPVIARVSREEELPLSFAQQRLWLGHQLAPGSSAYHVSNAVRLAGGLDVGSLEQALSELVRRHESLRTRFVLIDDEPVQLISPAGLLALPVTDLSMLPELDREASVRSLAIEQAQQLFDLEQGPLLRVALLRVGAEEHVLLITLHHIICDAWSLGIISREIATLYDAFSAGRPSPLPELPIQYVDYAYWQRRQLLNDGQELQLDYWKQQLAGAPVVLELPKERPRPMVQSFNGARESFQLPLSLSRSLQELSRREGATLFMTLLAAFQLLLSRYSGQEDIVVGTNVANRQRHDLEGLIGVFINNLVLRTDLSGNPSFKALIGRVREVCLEAYAHQDTPFEKLVEVLQPERDSSYPPLFQVMLTLQNTPEQKIQLPGLTANFVEFDHVTARADLMLNMSETRQGLFGVLEYNTDLFDASTATRTLKHFEALLEDVVAHPDKDLKSISLGREEESRQLIYSFNEALD
jgi:amino acid adenylation domain-containing protein